MAKTANIQQPTASQLPKANITANQEPTQTATADDYENRRTQRPGDALKRRSLSSFANLLYVSGSFLYRMEPETYISE